MGSKMASKNGVQHGVPDFGRLPQMVAPRQFCFDTLDGRGPRSARGPSGGHFPKWGPKWVQHGVTNGAQNGVQLEVQKWGPKWVPGFGGLPKMVAPRQFCFDTLDGLGPRSARGPSGGHFFSVFKNGDQNWIPKMGSKNEIQNGIQKWGPTAAITTSSYHHEQK